MSINIPFGDTVRSSLKTRRYKVKETCNWLDISWKKGPFNIYNGGFADKRTLSIIFKASILQTRNKTPGKLKELFSQEIHIF